MSSKVVPSIAFLQIHVKILKFFGVWDDPSIGFFQKYSFIILDFPSVFACFYDLIMMSFEDDTPLDIHIHQMVACIVILGQYYLVACFMHNKKGIRNLVENLPNFSKYTDIKGIIEEDKKAELYAKLLLLYSITGAFTYVSMPQFTKNMCEAARTETMIKLGIPCGLVCRVRYFWKYDYTPLYQITFLHQAFTIFHLSSIVIMLTNLIAGLVIHVNYNLKEFKKMVEKLNDCVPENVEAEMKKCIEYHIEIIKFSNHLGNNFGSQMFLHVTLTSVVISTIVFLITLVDYLEAIRHAMHLFGWFFLLFTLCHIGQRLIDESTSAAYDAFYIDWYIMPVHLQKNVKFIIMRSQKPLFLNIMGYSNMSYVTFLAVLSSAYSYFTILIHIQK